jgi:DNA polymerase III delta subunit
MERVRLEKKSATKRGDTGSGVYLFYGEDSLDLLREVQILRETFRQKYPQGVIEELSGSEGFTDESLRIRLQELLESRSLFADRKFLILRDFVDELNDCPKTGKYLLEVLPKLSKTVEALFVEQEGTDKRLRFFKQLQKIAETKDFQIPSGSDLTSWIKNRLARDGYEIKPAAMADLVSRLGEDYDMWQVETELEKLILYRLDDKTIGPQDVQKLGFRNISREIFGLTDLVANGQLQEAILLMEQMFQDVQASDVKSQPIQIVGILAAQIRSLLLVKDLEGQNSPEEIAKILDWKPGRVWINLKLAKKFTTTRLIRLLRDLKAIDYRLKTSEESGKLLLTLFFRKATEPERVH